MSIEDEARDLFGRILSELIETRHQRDELAANDVSNWRRLLVAVNGNSSFGRKKIVEAVDKLRKERDHLNKWLDKGMEVAQGFLDKPSDSHIVDRICIIGWERDNLRKEIERLKEKCGEQDNTICDLLHLLKRVESAFELADFPSAEQAASVAALNRVRPYIQEALRDHGEMS